MERSRGWAIFLNVSAILGFVVDFITLLTLFGPLHLLFPTLGSSPDLKFPIIEIGSYAVSSEDMSLAILIYSFLAINIGAVLLMRGSSHSERVLGFFTGAVGPTTVFGGFIVWLGAFGHISASWYKFLLPAVLLSGPIRLPWLNICLEQEGFSESCTRVLPISLVLFSLPLTLLWFRVTREQGSWWLAIGLTLACIVVAAALAFTQILVLGLLHGLHTDRAS